MHLALARKYRPQNFLEVIGQDPIVTTLKNAIQTGRLHHACLFCGVRGVGKTSMARILAKSINCETGPTITPCQKCSNCQSITGGSSLDVIEIDGASNNLVDDVRQLREQVKYLPTASRYKIIIIDEVHMLSNSAFNALLKTLEEPPPHVIFIFATTESHKLPLTIVSRCQKYDFKKLASPLLLNHLQGIAQKENIVLDEESLHLIVRCAQGSVRDALSLLDQISSYSPDQITAQNVRHLLGLGDRAIVQDCFKSLITKDLRQSLDHLNEIEQRGVDLKLFAEDLLLSFRHLVLIQSTGTMPPDLSPVEGEFFASLNGKTSLSLLLAQYQALFKAVQELAATPFQKTVLEIAFVKLSQIQNMLDVAELIQTLKNKQADRPVGETVPSAQTQNLHNGPARPVADWYDLVKWLTQEKPNLGNLLKGAVPVSFSPQKIEIAMPPDSPSKGMALERRQAIEEAFRQRLARKVDFSITDLTEEKKKPSASVN